MSQSNTSEHTNPLEILVKQNEILQGINSKLLDYYLNTAPELFQKNEVLPIEIKAIFESEKDNLKPEIEKIFKNLPKVELNLSEKDRNLMTKMERYLKILSKWLIFILGISIISLLITFTSGYFAHKFYKTSVLTKTELKQELLMQIENQGEIIVNEEYFQALNNEKTILSQFIEKDKKFKEMYNLYRDGIIDNNKEYLFFEKVNSNDAIKKNKAKIFGN